MINDETLRELTGEIIKALEKNDDIPFYNQPIFLTIVSIVFGSIALTIITKRIEERTNKRKMAIDFIDEVGANLNEVLSRITGYRKRKYFGNPISDEFDKKRAILFTNRFSVRVKSRVYLRSNIFWEEYEDLILDIDLFIYLISKIDKHSEEKIIERMRGMKKRMQDFLPLPEKDRLYVKNEVDYKEVIELEKILWLRANSLISEQLEKFI